MSETRDERPLPLVITLTDTFPEEVQVYAAPTVRETPTPENDHRRNR